MIQNYIYLRSKSVIRQITEAGWFWAIILALVIACLGVVSLMRLSAMPRGGLFAFLLSLAALVTLHTQRRDLPFLRTCAPYAYQKLLYVEYALLSLPFCIVLLLHREFLLLLSLCFCLAFLPYLGQVKLNRKPIRRFFGIQSMEMNAQWRLLWVGLVIGAVAFLSGVAFGRLVLALAGGGVVLSILFFSFHIPENWFYMAAFQTTGQKFLYRKTIICIVAVLPVLLLFVAGMIFRFPDTAWFVGVFACSYIVALSNNIAIKYAFPRNLFLIQFFQSFNFMLMWTGASILFTPFVCWQARQKLRILLDD